MTSQLADSETVGEMAALLRLLGDATRLRLLGLLLSGERHVTSLCAQLDLAQPTVSHHLALLRKKGLIQARRAGKLMFYSLNSKHLVPEGPGGGLLLTFASVKMHLGRSGQGLSTEVHASVPH